MSLKNKFFIELIKFFLIIFFIGLVRFVPHPPNFTAVIAIVFYSSLIYGRLSSLYVLASYILIDIYIGLHDTIYFVWFSILLISLIAIFFSKSIKRRISGVLISCIIFFLISNLGSWFSLDHSFDQQLLTIYYLGLPFFINSIISSFIFSFFIELYLFFMMRRQIFLQKKN